MLIAIEGADGVGKTTAAKDVANTLGFSFIEKPFQLFLGDKDTLQRYLDITKQINKRSINLRAWFYGLSILSLQELCPAPAVTDRFFLSCFAWNGCEENTELFDLLARQIRFPDLTVLLTASKDTIIRRLLNRSINDADLEKVEDNVFREKMMRQCLTRYSLPHIILSTDALTSKQVCDRICKEFSHRIKSE